MAPALAEGGASAGVKGVPLSGVQQSLSGFCVAENAGPPPGVRIRQAPMRPNVVSAALKAARVA
jgi:hypothetical protein